MAILDSRPSRPTSRRTTARPVWAVVAAASLPMFMATLDNLIVTNALPTIRTSLGATIDELQWVVNAYTLAFAGAILLAAGIGDRIGRRTVFLGGTALFTVASALAALSTDPGQLIAARAVQGIGGAAIVPLSLALITGAVPVEKRGIAIGVWGGISGLGVAVGPLIGGLVLGTWPWEAIFWINVPVGVVAVAFARFVFPNAKGAREPLDVVGALLGSGATVALVYGIIRGGAIGWGASETILWLVGAGLLLVLFLGWQSRARYPLLPLGMFRNRPFTASNILGFGMSFGMFGAIFILIQFLQLVQGNTALEAAWKTAPWTLAPMVVAPAAGLLVSRIGARPPIAVGLALQAAGLAWIAVVLSRGVDYPALVPPFVLAGVGMGLVFAPLSTALLATLPEHDHAKASGANATLREVGIALGIAVSTTLFTTWGGTLTPTGFVDAARGVIVVSAVVLAATALAAAAVPGTAGRVAAAGKGASRDVA
ncbi:DHA2 family efflux MFS transporter permease subunit [Sinomonas sp. ASV322]|uniref:DHA2 family efflux MFS transporter permease subunit n=1 Tax=Sinomonas sp. ASV322 TaxID=3041920 RepID=UPI0027DE2AA2|nr:DHA2 family efflux MFS transporter permease subunit [Sinomonas sp. ASV322]MDQ4501360.1 DHA2 family efflux MFS transporter permease subunit [Sinomonas sp. ASV322]